ncbi:hypothetical protein PoB_000515000 [Plakobranchus ocellatus]|uniref:Uncharacterized protein n=1 Tax=Plakobranchus ocellatus TaxID=259542 RepID=A0AAV3Y772_9GAST|nr:hypothetical protein PoB_000515000 [Plakobranchus ocellatus]
MSRVVKTVVAIVSVALPGSLGFLYWYHRRQMKACREADEKRNDQGNHECEVMANCNAESMEASLIWKKCTKHPGHSTFIPVEDFSITHLPNIYQSPELVEIIENVASRTVRLRVKDTSPARPDGYVFSRYHGRNITHTGTGWVRDIHDGQGPCRCPDCASKQTPMTRWWLVRIHTACHVVYDTLEAKVTSVDINSNHKISGLAGKAMTMNGLKVISKNEEQDLCRFYCATHDEILVDWLQTFTAQWEHLSSKKLTVADNAYSAFCVVVSHPHGQAKCVTIGKWKKCSEQNEIGECAQMYTTDTCRGSSGAPVILLKNLRGPGGWVPTIFPHSQTLDDGLNQSAIGGMRSY